MYLIRLMYASEQSSLLSSNDIEQILAVAQRKNAEAGITGLLCFNSQYFLQCLEGARNAVNETFNHIQRDPRHKRIVLLGYQQIAERAFNHWSMGYVPATQFSKELIMKYSSTTDFDPYRMSENSSLAFLDAMAGLIAK